jgi:hypothetical protein
VTNALAYYNTSVKYFIVNALGNSEKLKQVKKPTKAG